MGKMAGPVWDVGCGPGRLWVGPGQRGVLTLAIDRAPRAIRMARTKSSGTAPWLQTDGHR